MEQPESTPSLLPGICPYCCVHVDDLRTHLRASFKHDTDEQIERMAVRAASGNDRRRLTPVRCPKEA